MPVLLIGGSGYVGALVAPLLLQQFTLRIFDLRPPVSGSEYVHGDATDYPALLAAMADVDAIVHCAMGPVDGAEADVAAAAFDVNVKSVHHALSAAREAGVPHLVYVSSMSVYEDLLSRRLDESVAPDARDVYGLTKRLGEEVCRAAAAEYGLSVNVLRLAWPTPDRDWPAWGLIQPPDHLRRPDGAAVCATAATDVAAAISAALDYRDGFQAFMVSSDDIGGRWSTEKARTQLSWRPEFDTARMNRVIGR
jgi:nucleoside-diphosphate-sugar epimerase